MIPADFDYRARSPSPPLDRAVERVWYARGTSPHGKERILPSPSPVLLLVVGPPLRMTAPHPDARPEERAGAWLQGPHERPVLNEPTGETHVLGAVVRPGGLPAFLGENGSTVSKLAHRIVPVAELGGPLVRADELIEPLSRAGPDEALDTVLAWLGRALRPSAVREGWIAAIGRLVDGDPPTVAEVQRSMGVSRRYFTERVRRLAGLPPKTLQRIGRMRRLVAEIDTRRPIRWSREAVGAGYFDQPHAIRDFKAFTGMTPTEYIERRRRAWGDEVEPGEAPGFVPERT